ncbi:transcription repressor NadR [Fundicoccus culcitae]|uniref:Transcription repressor NadR n=1 Tax=Fundicoccus culcitae TaxID=2969821 RepID=A0ABY5P2Z6_9LACT|nr:transcription repressor NadR [Fundicoccus culcitae]UUX33099.1 transcription repressor NadR [Fundicoccus culcitae]
MQAKERRQRILEFLQTQTEPVTASQLAKQFKVSRQIIVGDIALLRAHEHDILATNQGYLLTSQLVPRASRYTAKVVVQHEPEASEAELRLIVDHGGEVEDIQVDHPFYGLITAPLNIRSHQDVDYFMEQMALYSGTYLSSLTNGIHIHTVSCVDKQTFEKLLGAMGDAGLLLDEE